MGKKFSLETVINLADGITKPLAKAEKGLLKFSGNMKKKWGGLGKDIQSADKMINSVAKGAVLAGGAAVVGAAMIGKSFIDAGAEVEGYKTVLKTMLGSQEAANKRFEEMSKFAASTPFELNEVVQLGNQLQALGQYSEDNMKLLGDLAAASGKPIEQVTGAFAKLVSGQKGEAVNMFRDLLISTGDWSAATGKGIKKTGELMATTEEMIAALPMILGKKGFTGMMDNLSKTNKGIQSNFADTITRFKQSVGGILLPAYNRLLQVLTSVVEKFTQAFNQDGKKYVEQIASGIEQFAVWLSKVDIGKIIQDFISFGRTVVDVIKFLAPLKWWIIAIVGAIKLASIVLAGFNVIMAITDAVTAPVTGPIILITLAIGALIIGVKMLSDHMGGLKNVFLLIGQTISVALLSPVNAVIDAIRGLLMLISKIPGVGKFGEEALKAVEDFQSGMNKMFTGSAQAYDFGGAYESARAPGYAAPSTRTAESRSYTESRTVNEVQLTATPGTSMRPAGGAPARTLNYGAIQ